jgi:hypothetical protein
MTLKEVIDWIEKKVAFNKFAVLNYGFNASHSCRRNYSYLAFSPARNTPICEMLQAAKKAIGSTYTGWKGGAYRMDERSVVYIGDFGGSEVALTEEVLDFMYYILGNKNAKTPLFSKQ